MRRNENLVLLSKDHHFGLLCCWKIRQGLALGIDVERIKRYVRYFWEIHLSGHFDAEERVLPAQEKDPYTDQIKEEHAQIKAIATEVDSHATYGVLSNFADLLEQHIRFEEREWFPHLERHLQAASLQKIGEELQQIHLQAKDDYKDEFWK